MAPLLQTFRQYVNLRTGFYFGNALLFFHFVTDTFVSVKWVTGNSMSPTLCPDYATTGKKDWLLVMKRTLIVSSSDKHFKNKWFVPEVFRMARGDVVVFDAPHDPGSQSVKRVIGLAGDTILRAPVRVGKQQKEDGENSKKLGMRPLPPMVKVPYGHIWVEGDNWRDSRDSNDFGPIPIHLVKGRARAILWPWDKFWSGLDKKGNNKGRSKVASSTTPEMADIGYLMI